jgi:hypothetical protein
MWFWDLQQRRSCCGPPPPPSPTPLLAASQGTPIWYAYRRPRSGQGWLCSPGRWQIPTAWLPIPRFRHLLSFRASPWRARPDRCAGHEAGTRSFGELTSVWSHSWALEIQRTWHNAERESFCLTSMRPDLSDGSRDNLRHVTLSGWH